MTKPELIAHALHDLKEQAGPHSAIALGVTSAALTLAESLRLQDPRFDRESFLSTVRTGGDA